MFIIYVLCVSFRRAQEMVTQDAKGRCQGVWSSQPPGRGPKGFHLGPKGDRWGPRTKHMLKHTCHPQPLPQLLGREINTLSLCPLPGAQMRGQQVSFFLSSQIEIPEVPSTYNVSSPSHRAGRTWAGEGVAVSAHPAWGSFMLNRGGATLIPTSSKTGQERPPGPFLAPS